MSSRRGFTLLELLLVVCMLSVISLAIYSTFNNGVKIWQRLNKPLAEEDVGIFFDKFSRDIRNVFWFSGIDFSGSGKSLEFPTLVHSVRLQKRTVGQIGYFFDSASGSLKRTEKDLTHITEDEKGLVMDVLSEVRDIKFSYYFYNKEKNLYEWSEEWTEKDLPVAVRVKIRVEDDGERKELAKTISIPASGRF